MLSCHTEQLAESVHVTPQIRMLFAVLEAVGNVECGYSIQDYRHRDILLYVTIDGVLWSALAASVIGEPDNDIKTTEHTHTHTHTLTDC